MNKQEIAGIRLTQRAYEKSLITRAMTTRRVLVKGGLNEEVHGDLDPRYADVVNELRFGWSLLLRLPGQSRDRHQKGIGAMSYAELLSKMLEINKKKKTPEVTIFDRNGQIVEK